MSQCHKQNTENYIYRAKFNRRHNGIQILGEDIMAEYEKSIRDAFSVSQRIDQVQQVISSIVYLKTANISCTFTDNRLNNLDDIWAADAEFGCGERAPGVIQHQVQ